MSVFDEVAIKELRKHESYTEIKDEQIQDAVEKEAPEKVPKPRGRPKLKH